VMQFDLRAAGLGVNFVVSTAFGITET